jgi:hypothetical protein
MLQVDEQDEKIIAERMTALDAVTGPRVGDWVHFANEVRWRISNVIHYPADGDTPAVHKVQTSDGGSYHLGAGYVSMSGSLEDPVPVSSLTLTEQTKDARLWIFHHGLAGGDRGVDFTRPMRVYQCSLPAPGTDPDWRPPVEPLSLRSMNLEHLGTDGVLFRGGHELPHMSQVLRRDLHGEQILLAMHHQYGRRALGYARTRQDDRYNFLVYAPGSAGTNWTAFATEQDLRDFTEAYDLTIHGSLESGGRFELELPANTDRWRPVTVRVATPAT